MDKYINMDKILISFGTRPLAQRVGQLLQPHFQLVYATAESFPAVLKQQGYQVLPEATAATYAHELLKLCLDLGIQYVLPLGALELEPLHEARLLLEEYGITLLVPMQRDNYMFINSPAKELPLTVFHKGVNLLTGNKQTDDDFSGVGLLSDSQEEVALVLV